MMSAQATFDHAPLPEALRTPKGSPREAASGYDAIDCTAYASPQFATGQVAMVQVFAHQPEQQEIATVKANEADPSAKIRDYISLEMEVRRGATLSFTLDIPGCKTHDSTKSFTWRGLPRPAIFYVEVPEDCPLGAKLATVVVAADSVPAGSLRFSVEITLTVTSESSRPLGEKARNYRNAFISYASEDRAKVLPRVQMLARSRIQFFQDLLDLEPGVRWERELYRNIDNSDVFFLFWSHFAKESEWVMKEARYALERQKEFDSPDFVPVPIEGPPPVPPPGDMAGIHFNDPLLYFIKAEDELAAADESVPAKGQGQQ